MAIYTKYLNSLKAFFKPKASPPSPPSPQTLQLEDLEARMKGLESFSTSTTKVLLSHIEKFNKNTKFHEALFTLVSEQEEDIKELKTLINQHAQVINTMQKDLLGEPQDSDTAKIQNESDAQLSWNKKTNKDN